MCPQEKYQGASDEQLTHEAQQWDSGELTPKGWTKTNMLDDIMICDSLEAQDFNDRENYFVICVSEVADNPGADICIPLVYSEPIRIPKPRLDIVAAAIQYGLTTLKKKVVVHCYAGMERSPLAVVWYLHMFNQLTLDQAYEQVHLIRPETLDRRSWIQWGSLDDFLEGSNG